MKRILVAAAVMLAAPAGTAQAGVFDDTFGWAGMAVAPLSTNNGDHFNAIVNAPGGGYYAAGYVRTGANPAMAVAKLDASGRLDQSFGTGGVAVADQAPVDGAGTAVNEQARALVVQSDGKIVIGGPAPSSAPGATSTDTAVYVTRFTTGGVVDGSFGVGGTRSVDFSTGATSTDQSWGLILRPGDKLTVVAARGFDAGPGARTDRDFAFIGLTANGNLDPDWGDAGVTYPPRRTLELNGTTYELNENPRGGIAQPDGKVLTAGYAGGENGTPAASFTRPHIFRLLANGRLDTSFGDGGLAAPDLNGAMPNTSESYQLALQPDGKIVSVGYGNTGTPANVDLLVTRLTANGRLDTSFGNGGVARYDGGRADRARYVVVTPDEKILVAGNTEVGASSANGFLLRLNPDGSRDTSFGVNGALITDFGGTTDALFGLTLSPDGKQAIAAGWRGTAVGDEDSLALRLGIAPPAAPSVVTNTVTVQVPGPATPAAKPAVPRADATLKRSSKRLSGAVSSPTNVGKVLVRLTRGSGSRCRAYSPSTGNFTGRSCTAGKGFAVAYADGRWTLDLARKLTKASYALEVVAYGADGVAQTGATKVKFTVR